MNALAAEPGPLVPLDDRRITVHCTVWRHPSCSTSASRTLRPNRRKSHATRSSRRFAARAPRRLGSRHRRGNFGRPGPGRVLHREHPGHRRHRQRRQWPAGRVRAAGGPPRRHRHWPQGRLSSTQSKEAGMTGTDAVPRRFIAYAAAIVAAAVVALTAFWALAGVGASFGSATFWLLAVFVLIGEL